MKTFKTSLNGLAGALLLIASSAGMSALPAMAQAPAGPVAPYTGGTVAPAVDNAAAETATKPQKSSDTTTNANYVLGQDDQIIIRAFQAPERADKPIQIPGDGYISLPMVGRMKAAGLSVNQFEEELVERLKTYVLHPQVSVFVSDYRSQPVSVVGAVGTPGVVQLRGSKNLVEVIAMAGGLKSEAGNTITITREMSMGRIPLPDAKDGPNGQFSIATVNLRDVMDAHNPQGNILVAANDVIMIPRAQRLYVVGEVARPGAYELNEKDSASVLQVVALAGGLTSKASAKKARILYRGSNTANRSEVNANVKKILDGQAPDVELHADDILFVPNSLPKSAGAAALQTALGMAGYAVFRIP
jgi:polysaccharide export outer membrane protein